MLVFSFTESLVCCHCQRKERVSRAPRLPRTTKAVVCFVTPAWYSWTGGAVFMAAPQHDKKMAPALWSLTSNNQSTPTLLLALQASDKNVFVVRCWLRHRTPHWVPTSPPRKSWASCFCVPQFPQGTNTALPKGQRANCMYHSSTSGVNEMRLQTGYGITLRGNKIVPISIPSETSGQKPVKSFAAAQRELTIFTWCI